MLVAIRYLQEKELNVADFWQYVGRQFAAEWTAVEKGDVQKAVWHIARNMASCGGEVQVIQSSAELVRLAVKSWPPEEYVQICSISLENAAQMVEVFHPIAASLELSYEWQQEEDSTITMAIGH